MPLLIIIYLLMVIGYIYLNINYRLLYARNGNVMPYLDAIVRTRSIYIFECVQGFSDVSKNYSAIMEDR